MMHQQHQKLHRALLGRAPVPALTTISGQVMSVVYVTAEPTFTGVIGGYTTISQDDEDDSTTENAAPTRTSNAQSATSISSVSRQTQSTASRASSHATDSLTSAALTSSVAATAYLPATTSGQSTHSNTAVHGASATEQPSSSTSSEGMSIGAKIGLAVGIILGIGAIAIVALIFLARKRRQQEEQAQADSEKKAPTSQPIASNPRGPDSPNAPRLSLRPVSNLMPEFIGGSKQKSRLSQGNMLTPISESARQRNMPPSQITAPTAMSMAEKPRAGDNPFKDPENPFADPEKAMAGPMHGHSAPVSPITPASASPITPAVAVYEPAKDLRTSGPTAESFPIPQTQNQSRTGPVNESAFPPRSGPPAPISISNVTYAELPAAPSPTIAQGPGPETPQGNVYRILMDFRPTMDDELELRTGQVVRMLHEYDDGWALCIRLDRSQQGVVPRTCLAAKPSKPRPGPPPMGAGPRPITPQGRPRGPPGPQGSQGPRFGSPRAQSPAPAPTPARAQSPAAGPVSTGAFNQTPRPLSPGPRPQPQKRSMSPGPYGAGGPKPMAPAQQRRRSNSASAASVRNKRNSPPGPSKLGPGLPPVRSDSPGLAI